MLQNCVSKADRPSHTLLRKQLDISRKKYAVLKRKLETEFQSLDSLEDKVAELERIRAVSAQSK